MPTKVSKNGKDFFTIGDEPSELEIAMGKGYKPYVDVTKNGKDIFTIELNEAEVTTAVGKGYKQIDEYNKPTAGEAMLRGAGQGATFGFSDEAIGGVKSLMPDGKSYAEERDAERAKNAKAQKAFPGTYLTGELAGGAVLPLGAGKSAATIVGALGKGSLMGAISGGVSGAGYNERKENMVGDVAKGVAIGGVLGGGAGVAGRLIPGVATKAGRADLKGELEAYRRGMKNASDSGLGSLNIIPKVFKGIKETVDSSKDIEAFKLFIAGSKNNLASKMVDQGKFSDTMAAMDALNKLSNDDFVTYAIANGDKDVIQWIAKNSAGQGSKASAQDIEKLLSIDPVERQALRKVDVRQEAKNILPGVAKAKGEIESSVRRSVGELNTAAAAGADDAAMNKSIDAMIDSSTAAIEDLGNIPDGAAKAKHITAAMETMAEGKGPKSWPVGQGKIYSAATAEEKFNRIQKAREYIDDGLADYYGRNRKNPTIAETILVKQRRELDAALKAVEGKRVADLAAVEGYAIDRGVFRPITKGGEVDTTALKRVLGSSDKAQTFQDEMERIADFAANTTDAEGKAAAEQLLNLYKTTNDKVILARAINDFNHSLGPTSPAVERLGSQLGKRGMTEEAIQAPALYMRQLDANIENYAELVSGKKWHDMGEDEKRAFVNLLSFIKKDGDKGVTPEALKENFNIFLKKQRK